MGPPNPDQPLWLQHLDPRAASLRPPATAAQIDEAEAALKCLLPADYREFLAIADGATFRTANSRFHLLPVSRALRVGPKPAHNDLVDYNALAGRADDPFLAIGIVHNPDEHIGFLKSDLARRRPSCPLYLEWHETGDHDRWADSFAQFLASVAKAGLAGDFEPRPAVCPSCRYDLTGNVSGVCPECGGKW
jgi:hypothetical protein